MSRPLVERSAFFHSPAIDRDEAERRSIARDYAEAVQRLIHSGQWQEMPALEDQLPDEWMPECFYEFWMGN